MGPDSFRGKIRNRHARGVWWAAVAVYMLAVFHRTSLSVAGLLAVQRLALSAAQLSSLIVFQLCIYAAMQIPAGALADRFGPKRLLTTSVLLLAAGQLMFAFSWSYSTALMARGVVGLGDSLCYVSVLRIVAVWFTPMRVPVITQLTGLLGNAGGLVAAVPMAALLRLVGWTPAFAIVAGIGVGLGVAVRYVVRDHPDGSGERCCDVPIMSTLASLRQAWSRPGTRLGMWSHFATMFSANCLALLWGFPFLVKGEGFAPNEASLIITLMICIEIATAPAFGWLVARSPRKRVAIILSVVGCIVLCWTAVLARPFGDRPWIVVTMFLIAGLGAPASAIGFDFARTSNVPASFGAACGIVNVGGFSATIAVVLGVGIILNMFGTGGSSDYSSQAFLVAMAVQYPVWGLGVVNIIRYNRRTHSVEPSAACGDKC